jgi:uncharacterized protein (DUF433 family)
LRERAEPVETEGHAVTNKEYVERRDDSFYLAGSRVPLAHVVRQFHLGSSPEAIRSYYPTLSLEQVYGAITFYLGNKDEVEQDIDAREREEDAFSTSHPPSAEMQERFERMRRQMASRQS